MESENFNFEDFCRYKPVPRETFDRLQEYTELLFQWQKAINLVGNTTLKDAWNRHIIDSIQLLEHIEDQDKILDLGSGAGLPGLVIAMVRGGDITLVESDGRKVAFLKEASRLTQTNVKILHQRVEKTTLDNFTLIIARGFAPLVVLLNILFQSDTLKLTHKLLLLKGKNHKSEIEAASNKWSFDHDIFPSVTDKDGVILSIRNVKNKEVS